MSGAGAQSAGATLAGLGTPATLSLGGGTVFRDDKTGLQLDCRRIDHETGRYEFDSNGRILGDTQVRQQVKLAVLTTARSSVDAQMGHRLSDVKYITRNYEEQIRQQINAALQRLTSSGLVTVNAVNVSRTTTGRVVVEVRYTDLTTGLEQEVVI